MHYDLHNKQRELQAGRLSTYYAACDGTFVVRNAETNEIIEGNNILDCVKFKIEWTNTRFNDRTRGDVAKGSDEILFLSPASLCMEYYCFNLGTFDEHFKFLEGGILYVVGEPHLFWSLMIHRKATGKCFPPQPQGQKTWNWDSTWAAKEAQRIMTPVLQSPPGSTQRPHAASRSMSALSLLKGTSSSGSASSPPPFLSAIMNSEDHLMTVLPSWWTKCESFWTGALDRALLQNSATCMYFCTPVGCTVLASTCRGCHDTEYASAIAVIKGTVKGRRPSSHHSN